MQSIPVGGYPVVGRKKADFVHYFLRILLILSSVLLFGFDAFFVETSGSERQWTRPEGSHTVGAIEDGDPRVEAHLIVDQLSVSVGGTLRAAVVFEIDPDWHIYWRNSGEAGLSTEVEFQSDNVSFGPLNWAAPRPFLDPAEIVATFGFSDAVLLWASGTVDAEATGTLTVTATVDYLACKVECIPGSGTLRRTVKIGASEPSDEARWFTVAADQMARSTASEGVLTSLEIHSENGLAKAVLGLRCSDCELEVIQPVARYALMPDEGRNVLWKTTSVKRNGPETSLSLEGEINADGVRGPCSVRGVVWVRKDGVAVPLEIDQPYACEALTGNTANFAGTEQPLPKPPTEPVSLWYALLLAFIGGMILNLMPCVFPVLAVKVFAFVKLAHEEKSQVLSHSVAYTAGVVGTMLSLAIVVVGLKMAGTQVGWGFQFQEPLFVALLSAILVLFAMNLFGAFEVMFSVQQKKAAEHTLGRSAGEGVLAVVLATPCSAPFLGTAVGFALAASPATVFAIFGMLGLGLAFPFVVLTMVPGWTRVLPKPGEWMLVFKQILGFALLGTVVWLVWILGQSVGVTGATMLLIFLLTVAIAAWAFGRVQFATAGRKWAVILIASCLVMGTGFFTLRFPAAQTAVSVVADDGWEPWSHERVAKEQELENVVFVDFTADWCITCKVNESTVLVSDEVEAAFKAHNVVKLKGDWTRRDEEIRKVLESYGKGGVPLYLVYGPGAPDGTLLPELLTSKIVVDALQEASRK